MIESEKKFPFEYSTISRKTYLEDFIFKQNLSNKIYYSLKGEIIDYAIDLKKI